jgi:D-3-phosphoglycerate dehydrogenase
MKAFVSTHPFGSVDSEPLDVARAAGVELELNPYGRKIKPEDLKKHLKDKEALIAGTEKLGADIMDCAPGLKLIARVGIGLDGIDFDEIRKRKILVTYTPDAVTRAVAELTVANMLNLARSIHVIHAGMKKGTWSRIIGFELLGKTIGIIGFGRVGQTVARLLSGFSCKILVNDISPDEEVGSQLQVKFCSKEEIYKQADIITLHVPITPLTHNLINEPIFSTMKKSAYVINTSRGGIVNESDLYEAVKNNVIAGAAVDVYEMEPYISGRLCELDNIILTAHSGSCSKEARYLMEVGAAREVANFAQGKPPICPVPDETITVERTKTIVPINADWHELVTTPQESRSDRYKLYRKRWGQYPTHFIESDFPLNVDVEAVKRNDLATPMSSDYMLLPVREKDCSFMDLGLFKQLLEEVKQMKEPVAIKLGFRGDPLMHHRIFEMIELAKEAGAIEIILSASGNYLSESVVSRIAASSLDVINVLTAYMGRSAPDDLIEKDRLEQLCISLERLRRIKILNRKNTPKVRMLAEISIENADQIEEFKQFWGHWADVIAVTDPPKVPGSDEPRKAVKWACSKIWQRIMVAHDGKILLCNYDTLDRCCMGTYPGVSIREAWKSARIRQIREMHRQEHSADLELCRLCPFRKAEVDKLAII